MPTVLFVPLALTLLAYYAYYWSALTSVMIDEARQARLKRHLDWTIVSGRGLSRSEGWKFW